MASQPTAGPHREGEVAAIADATRFTGPRMRLMCIRNADQATRYPFTDPGRFLTAVQRRWGAPLGIDVIDERDDVEACCRARLTELDCLVLLSNSTHDQTVCDALANLRSDLARWLRDGGALCILHTGRTHRPDWVPAELDLTFDPVDGAVPPLIACRHLIAEVPFPAAVVCHPDHPIAGYDLRYKLPGGGFAETAAPVIEDAKGPAVLAGHVGSGRVVVSPLMMDWHGYTALFVNALCWLTRLRIVAATGEARALMALPATNRVRIGVVVSPEDGLESASAGTANDVTLRGGVAVELHEPDRLRVEPGELKELALHLLATRMADGEWGSSPNQTIEICRYLYDAGCGDAARDAVRRLRELASTLGDTFVARVHGVVLASTDEVDEGLRSARAATLRALEREIARRTADQLVDDGAKLLLGLLRAGERETAKPVAIAIVEAVVERPSPEHEVTEESFLLRRLREYTAVRVATQIEESATELLSERLDPPLGELLAIQPPSPLILDFLEACALGRPADELIVPEDYFNTLLLYAYADLRDLDRLSSVLVARHLAFWTSQPQLAMRAARLLATTALVESPPPLTIPANPDIDLLRERVGEAFELLEVPHRERTIARSLDATLQRTPGRSVLRAAIRLSTYPAARIGHLARAIGTPVLGAGFVGLLPLLAKDALQTLVVTAAAVRWGVAAALVVLCAATAWLSDRVSVRHFAAVAAVLFVWTLGVLAVATANFESDVATWAGGHDLVAAGWTRLSALARVAIFPSSILLTIATVVLAWKRPST